MSLIWATRGRTWGFRFLLAGGLPDPLPQYAAAFSGFDDEPVVFRRAGNTVALRFPDPEGREDVAGRVISHDLVAFAPLADRIKSVEDGVRVIWAPELAAYYQDAWDSEAPPDFESQSVLR